MILFRTCRKDRTSHNGFKWNPPGQETIAPDWNPDPKINCGKGLHGISNEESMCVDYLHILNEYIFQIVKVKEEDCVLSCSSDKYRFKEGIVIEEVDCSDKTRLCDILIKHKAYNILVSIKIPKNYNINGVYQQFSDKLLYSAGRNWQDAAPKVVQEIFNLLEGEKLYLAGCYWNKSVITDKLLQKAFERLEGEWLFRAGYNWRESAITDDMLKEAFYRLEGKWLYYADCKWRTSAITKDMLQDAFSRLNGEWLYQAGCDWDKLAITDNMLQEAFDRLEGEWLYRAGCWWRKSAITNELLKKAFKKLEREWLYRAGLYWRTSAISDRMLWEAFPRLEEEWKVLAKRDWRIFNQKEVRNDTF